MSEEAKQFILVWLAIIATGVVSTLFIGYLIVTHFILSMTILLPVGFIMSLVFKAKNHWIVWDDN